MPMPLFIMPPMIIDIFAISPMPLSLSYLIFSLIFSFRRFISDAFAMLPLPPLRLSPLLISPLFADYADSCAACRLRHDATPSSPDALMPSRRHFHDDAASIIFLLSCLISLMPSQSFDAAAFCFDIFADTPLMMLLPLFSPLSPYFLRRRRFSFRH